MCTNFQIKNNTNNILSVYGVKDDLSVSRSYHLRMQILWSADAEDTIYAFRLYMIGEFPSRHLRKYILWFTNLDPPNKRCMQVVISF